MSKTFRPKDIDQAWLPPPSLHDFVSPGHLAHFVRDLVRETLDLAEILSVYDKDRGYPPYHPAMMVAVLLYGYSQGVYSSRRLARGADKAVPSGVGRVACTKRAQVSPAGWFGGSAALKRDQPRPRLHSTARCSPSAHSVRHLKLFGLDCAVLNVIFATSENIYAAQSGR